MNRALVVSSTEFKTSALFGPESGLFADAVVCRRADEARRMMSSDSFSLIVVNAPLEDELGTDLACDAAERTSAGILLFVKAQLYEVTAAKAEGAGVIVVSKPCQISYARQCVRIAAATAARMRNMKRTVANLQNKVAEIKTVDRAKLVLMQYLGFSEEAAHKYIEKEAMNSRKSRFEVASEILRTYEN
ncbi:MAG TPA: ANTAR domain-containing protein [Candidatus Ornithoclostridium excrementipullorum]|nr:ANTAR domain-containing protein [Candidatus Ornithoclostridium excrementipullorum]